MTDLARFDCERPSHRIYTFGGSPAAAATGFKNEKSVVRAAGASNAPVVAGQLDLLGRRMPDGLGLKDGRLKPPSDTENSVSS